MHPGLKACALWKVLSASIPCRRLQRWLRVVAILVVDARSLLRGNISSHAPCQSVRILVNNEEDLLRRVPASERSWKQFQKDAEW